MKPDEKMILHVAQEITFAKALSGNNKAERDRALRRLQQWLIAKSENSGEFTEEGFMRIWKGLFYCLWMADKPLIQENVAENIGQLLHCFSKFEDTRMFFRCFFQAMSQAWFGLDQHRLDKFMMLERRCLRKIFECLNNMGWRKKQLIEFTDDLHKLLSMSPVGMVMHISEIYLEELAKIGRGNLKSMTVLLCVKPFAKLMAESEDFRLISFISNGIFLYLMRQSEEGIIFESKFEAWKQLGFPGGNIDVLEEVPQNDNDNDADVSEFYNGEMDPRAGSVDVLLPPLPFNPISIVNLFNELRAERETTTRGRRAMVTLAKKFSILGTGKYPLGIKQFELPESEDEEESINVALAKLLKETEEESHDEEEQEEDGARQKPKRKVRRRRRVRSRKDSWEVSETSVETGKKEVEESREEAPVGHGKWEVTPIATEKRKCSRLDDAGSTPKKKLKNETPNSPKSAKKKAKEGNSPKVNGSAADISPTGGKGKRKISKENKTDSNNSITNWGKSEWDEPLKDGEVEIFVPNKKYSKRASLNSSQIKDAEGTPRHLKKAALSTPTNTPGSAKKVAFVLNRNTAQEENEYMQALKQKPSIPYDANKKPTQGVLKPSAVASPINPFYAHLIKPQSIKL